MFAGCVVDDVVLLCCCCCCCVVCDSYRLAIVGGGPAGTSIIVRAIHLDVSNELCSFGAKRDNKVCSE